VAGDQHRCDGDQGEHDRGERDRETNEALNHKAPPPGTGRPLDGGQTLPQSARSGIAAVSVVLAS
jgi:hypothetical protein